MKKWEIQVILTIIMLLVFRKGFLIQAAILVYIYERNSLTGLVLFFLETKLFTHFPFIVQEKVIRSTCSICMCYCAYVRERFLWMFSMFYSIFLIFPFYMSSMCKPENLISWTSKLKINLQLSILLLFLKLCKKLISCV